MTLVVPKSYSSHDGITLLFPHPDPPPPLKAPEAGLPEKDVDALAVPEPVTSVPAVFATT